MIKKLYEETKIKFEKGSKTAKCPKCGNKYLIQTGYCVSCKKKVAEPKSEKKKEEIEVVEEFQIPGTDIILEVGDKLRVVESMQREAFIYKAKDGNWYYFIAHREYGEYPKGNTYGPFSSNIEAENHMKANHSNPGGFYTDESGRRPVPLDAIGSGRF